MENKYLLDANSFISPYKNYYPFDFAPGFWQQLKVKIDDNTVFIPKAVLDELEAGNDDLTKWAKEIKKENVLCEDKKILEKLSEILNYLNESPLYLPGATEKWDIEKTADPWIIATASVNNLKIVTLEAKNNGLSEKQPSKSPKIPDVAEVFGVKCINLFEFMRENNMMWHKHDTQ